MFRIDRRTLDVDGLLFVRSCTVPFNQATFRFYPDLALRIESHVKTGLIICELVLVSRFPQSLSRRFSSVDVALNIATVKLAGWV